MLTAHEVLARTDLAELLTSLSGPPVGSGRGSRWACFSPDHHDANPSVTMFVDRKGIERWRCWSDGHAGTAIDAVMISHNLDVGGALRWLGERAGHLPDPPARPRPAATVDRPLSSAARTWAAECEQRLWRPEGSGALEWLHRRGLDDPVLRANRIGFDPGAAVVGRPGGLPRWRGVTVCSYNRTGEPRLRPSPQPRREGAEQVQQTRAPNTAPSPPSPSREEHPPADRCSSPKGSSTVSSPPRPAAALRR